MPEDVFVVRNPTGRFEADCFDERCGFGLHLIAECDSKQEANRAMAAHQRELRAMDQPTRLRDREIDRLRAAIEQARALHSRDDSNPFGPWCGICMAAWPCETRRALDAPEIPGDA